MSIPWVDKYRPKKIDHIIDQEEIKIILKNCVKTGELPNLLLYGPPGTGKTSIIIALAYELFGPNVMNERILELNASDERGIDTVREKIITFAKESINTTDEKYPCPPYKIIVLDEADAITLDAQSALRKVIESSSKITRFCFTCNYIDKIIDPIISRCVKFRFKPINKINMTDRLKFIAQKENLVLSDKCIDKIHEISEGDGRKAIMILQNTKYIYGKKITPNDIQEMVGLNSDLELENVWSKLNTKDITTMIDLANYIHKSGFNIYQFLNFIKNKIIETELSDNKKSMTIMKICDTEARLIERGDEYLNILNLLCLIYAQLGN